MPLLSLRTVDRLPLPQYLPPGPLGKDKVMLQPLCHPSVLLLPASPHGPLFGGHRPKPQGPDPFTWAEDPGRLWQGSELGQASLRARGVGGDDGAPPGRRNSPSPEPLFLSPLSGPLLQPEMCSRPLRAGSKMLTTFSPPNSRTKPFSLSPKRSWGGGLCPHCLPLGVRKPAHLHLGAWAPPLCARGFPGPGEGLWPWLDPRPGPLSTLATHSGAGTRNPVPCEQPPS